MPTYLCQGPVAQALLVCPCGLVAGEPPVSQQQLAGCAETRAESLGVSSVCGLSEGGNSLGTGPQKHRV